MGKKKRKFKIGITIVLGLLIVCCYTMIFMFSADNAEESSVVSQKVTEMLVRVYHAFFERDNTGGITGAEAGFGITEMLEKIVRKLAHFMEYMILGTLSYLLAELWINKKKICVVIIIVQLLISAGLDEWHQSFVPGRYASFGDVIIDIAGGMTGALLVIGIIKLKNKRKRVTG